MNSPQLFYFLDWLAGVDMTHINIQHFHTQRVANCSGQIEQVAIASNTFITDLRLVKYSVEGFLYIQQVLIVNLVLTSYD